MFIPSSLIQTAPSVKIDVSRIATAQQNATLGSRTQKRHFTKNTQEPPWASKGGKAAFMANDSHPLEDTLPAVQGSISDRVRQGALPKVFKQNWMYFILLCSEYSEDYHIIPEVQYLHFNMCNTTNHWGLFLCSFIVPIVYSIIIIYIYIFYNIPLCLHWVYWFLYSFHCHCYFLLYIYISMIKYNISCSLIHSLIHSDLSSGALLLLLQPTEVDLHELVASSTLYNLNWGMLIATY